VDRQRNARGALQQNKAGGADVRARRQQQLRLAQLEHSRLQDKYDIATFAGMDQRTVAARLRREWREALAGRMRAARSERERRQLFYELYGDLVLAAAAPCTRALLCISTADLDAVAC
jgi:hypothetical protein